MRTETILVADIFDEDYCAMPGTQPQQHVTKSVDLADRLFPKVQESWPLPALFAWAATWGVFLVGTRGLDMPPVAALLLGAALACLCSLAGDTLWRRVFIASGFPMSLAVSGLVSGMPAWAWLLPLVLLATVYPVQTWRDAPVFPTPTGALRGLHALAPLNADARILDAGCGLGDALIQLRGEYPKARLVGMEWSWPLRIACGWRVRFASVHRADIWAADWSGFDMVYLFQRPDNIARAVAKAERELRPGAWVASLEFEARDLLPTKVLSNAEGRCVWLYRAPFRKRTSRPVIGQEQATRSCGGAAKAPPGPPPAC